MWKNPAAILKVWLVKASSSAARWLWRYPTRIPIQQKLADLPATPDEIAIKLAELGIQGRRGSSWKCPIANYLGDGVTVTPDKIVLDSDKLVFLNLNHSWICLPVPEPVAEFIGKFDAGEYPELIEFPVHVTF